MYRRCHLDNSQKGLSLKYTIFFTYMDIGSPLFLLFSVFFFIFYFFGFVLFHNCIYSHTSLVQVRTVSREQVQALREAVHDVSICFFLPRIWMRLKRKNSTCYEFFQEKIQGHDHFTNMIFHMKNPYIFIYLATTLCNLHSHF